MIRRLAMVVLVTALTTGCSKTFSGVDLNGKVNLISISGALENAEGAPTILRVRVSLDGNEISNTPLSPAANRIGISGARAGARGHHTIVVVVADQTSSPNNYRVSGLQVRLVESNLLGGGPTLASTNLPDRNQLLSSGEGFSYQFEL